MGQPYVGEIRLFAGNFAPLNWNFCNGALVSIAQNEVLFQLIGTTYGGDGVNTYALPDLRSRVPVHQGFSGETFILGQIGGVETVTLTTAQLPAHLHTPQANSSPGNQSSPNGGVWAQSTLDQFSSVAPATPMAANAVALSGGSQPHDNMLPFLALNFIISMFGIFPSQS